MKDNRNKEEKINKLRITLLSLIAIYTALMLMSCNPIPQGQTEFEENTIQNVWMKSGEIRYVIYNFSSSNTFTKTNGIWQVGESQQTYNYQANESVVIYGNDIEGDYTKEYQIVGDTLYFEGYELVKIN